MKKGNGLSPASSFTTLVPLYSVPEYLVRSTLYSLAEKPEYKVQGIDYMSWYLASVS